MWYMLALGRLRQEDHEFKTNLSYTVRPYVNKLMAGDVLRFEEIVQCKGIN
jgi:hypothetical protein